MTEPPQTSSRAWLPLTPRGVGSFASARARRLFVAQLIVAALAAVAVVWFLNWAWLPTIQRAIKQLPARGEIRSGSLIAATNAPLLLAEGHFLAFIVDPRHTGAIRSPAQIQVEFGERNVRMISLFGYTELSYPKHWIIAFNRSEVEPWWGAWRMPLRWIAGVMAFVGVLVNWLLLGVIYAGPVWLVGFFENRDLNLRASWKLAEAALIPGALVMIAGIALYGFGVLDLVQFLTVFGMHFAVGWIYCFVSPFFVPKLRSTDVMRGNPFAGPPAAKQAPRAAHEGSGPPPSDVE